MKSLIKIKAEYVIEVCKAYEEFWHKRSDRRKEEFIEREMNKKWFRAKTREKAIKRARTGLFEQPFWLSTSSWWLEKAIGLQQLAQTAIDQGDSLVFLSYNDNEILIEMKDI